MEDIHADHWNEHAIKKTAKILYDAERNKSTLIRILDEIVHWLILVVILFGNLLIAVFLILVSGLFKETYFYILTAMVALIFGFLVEIPLREIEKIDKHKSFMSRVMIPLLALVNIYFWIGIKKIIESFYDVSVSVNVLVAGIIYAVGFILPWLYYRILKKMG